MAKHRVRRRTLHLKHLLQRLPIRRQLLLVYFIAGILPVLLVGGYLLLSTRQLVMKQHLDQAAADNTRVRSILLDTTISLSNIADDFFNDRDLTNLLSKSYATDEDAYAAMRDYTKAVTYSVSYTEIESLTLYFQNATMRDYGHFRRLGEAERGTAWFQNVSGSAGYHWMTVSHRDKWGNELHELTLLRRIPVLKRGEFAILAIAVNRNYLKSRIETSQLKTEVAVNNDPLFYSSLRKEAGQAFGITVPQGDKFFRQTGILPYAGQTDALVQVSTVLPIKSQDRLLIATIDPEAVPGTLRILLTSGSILLFALLVPLIMVAVFSGTMSLRIGTLRKEMHKVAAGDLAIIGEFNGNDELADLYRDLQIMIGGIKARDEAIFEEKMARQKLLTYQREMQFEMLSSQINPHFLYNTLETIRMKAIASGNREVATAIRLLGKSMRHLLETNGRPASLQAELDHAKAFLEIQKIRFQERVDYAFDIADQVDVDNWFILPLLLQPLVENAVLHGIEEREAGGLVQVAVFRDGETLEVRVTDNGAGLSDQELVLLRARLEREEPDPEVRSIGLYNVCRRIRLHYGEAGLLAVDSRPGGPTTVRVSLPMDAVRHPSIPQQAQVL